MEIKKYNIGLDFGTYQSKSCVFYEVNDVSKHEFIQFTDKKGNLSYFIPSKIELYEKFDVSSNSIKEYFAYGYDNKENPKKTFTYFKIAAAEDELFRIVSDLSDSEFTYNQSNNFDRFSPETLSVLYLTFLQFTIKDKFYTQHNLKPKGGAILQRLRQTVSDIELKFTVQLGIPTEWSKEVNIKRRRKFENILLLSSLLQSEYKNLEKFLNTSVDIILDKLVSLIGSLKNNTTDFIEKLNDYGLSVYPENAAGLTFLIKTEKLEPGYYIAADIGGGSTDISFFKVKTDNSISYLASESIMIAANNIYQHFTEKENPTAEEITESTNEIKFLVDNDLCKDNEKYFNSTKAIIEKIHFKIYQIFNQRVYYNFEKSKAKHAFAFQPCFFYGGGTMLPLHFYNQEIILHDDGSRNSLNYTYAKKETLENYLPKVDILPIDKSWEADFPLLIVAFGLSFVHSDKEYLWDVIDYKDKYHDELLKPKLIPHPVNEDMYIYDIFERKFYDTNISNNLKFDLPYQISEFYIKNYFDLREIHIDNIPPNTQWIFLTGENAFGKSLLLRSLFLGINGNNIYSEIDFENNTTIEVNLFKLIKNVLSKDSLSSFNSIKYIAAYGSTRINLQDKSSQNEINEKSILYYSLFNDDGILLNIEYELFKCFHTNSARFDILKQAILKLIPRLKNIRIKENTDEIVYTEQDNESQEFQDVKFSQLATGLKSTLAMIGDLMIRLFEIQPDAKSTLDLKGIVLIDEIEANLHPKYSVEIIGLLSETFPKIQFIASTHSIIPILGAPINSYFLKIIRTKEEGIKIVDLTKKGFNPSNLLPNSLLTSPLFDFDLIIPRSNKDLMELRTEDNYSEILKNDEIKKQLEEIEKENDNYPDEWFKK